MSKEKDFIGWYESNLEKLTERMKEGETPSFYAPCCAKTYHEFDEELVDSIDKVVKDKASVTVDTAYYRYTMNVSEKGMFLDIRKNYQVRLPRYGWRKDGHPSPSPCGEIIKFSLWFTNDQKVLMKTEHIKKDHWIGKGWFPATLKRVYLLLGDSLFPKLLHYYAQSNGYMFLNDVLTDFDEGHYLSTITFDDAIAYHNREEYVSAKYKRIAPLKMNFNKTNINLSYLLEKVIPSVPEDDYGLLSQIRSLDFFKLKSITQIKDYKTAFFKFYYLYYKDYINSEWFCDEPHFADGTDGAYEDMYYECYLDKERGYDEIAEINNAENEIVAKQAITLIEDYIRLMMVNGKRIPLRYSLKRIAKEHDNLATYHSRKQYLSCIDRDMKVPKNSKFNALRDILPKDFEWIKTRTRLADESVMQSHCVYSYAGDIKSDKCAIYSYLDEEGKYGKPSTRYTIEFAVSRKRYVIRQMQKAYNHGGSTSLAKEIENLIKSSNEERLKTA